MEHDRKKLDHIVFCTMFIGLIILPIHIRQLFFGELLGELSNINFLMCGVFLLFLATKQNYSKMEIVLVVLWLIVLVSLLASNREIAVKRTFSAICNCWLPVYIVFYKFEKNNVQKLVGRFLLAFNIFITGLLLLALVEKFTGGAVLHIFVSFFASHGLECRDLLIYDSYSSRFFSIWGHTLTNAILFNMFFIMNDLYYRCIRKKYPKWIFFVISLTGVLLCAGKTALVVLALYLVVTNWKDKKWFIVYGAVAAVMYVMGAFDLIIQRFSEGTLTTGRVTALKEYFASGLYPFRFFWGYGTGTAYLGDMSRFKAGFEFPLMMFSLDYGMFFAIVMVCIIYIYASYYLLKRKQTVGWLGYSLLYAQISTYNGVSLRNQDMGWLLSVFTLIVINCVQLYEDSGQSEVEESSENIEKPIWS